MNKTYCSEVNKLICVKFVNIYSQNDKAKGIFKSQIIKNINYALTWISN